MNEMEFKTFDKTYQKISFALITTAMFPNPETDVHRFAAIPLLIFSVSPVWYMIFIDMCRCWIDWDIINVVRHSTVLGPFVAGGVKMLLLYHKRIPARRIVDEITRDHLLFNDPHYKHKDIARTAIRKTQIFSENCWTVIISVCVAIFPLMAVFLNTYNFLFKSEPVKYMVHDVNVPNLDPEKRFDSPYFELVFVYMCYCAVIYAVCFIGYDGLFGIAICHACMKMSIFCAELEDVMKSESREIYNRLVSVIKEQCRMYDYVAQIQDTFNVWLGLIFIITIVHICTCCYIIIEGYGIDVRYMLFIIAGVAHIYLPCQYAANVKEMSLETADKIYCCGWEHVDNQSVKQMIIFMITRAQIPINISAFNMINFDMKLFVSLMHTSYSMFALLRS